MSMLNPGAPGKRPPAAKRGKQAKVKAKAKAGRAEPAKEEKKPKKTLETPAGAPFKTIPQYGRDTYGLSKNGSYDAAARGDFGEIVEIGRRKFVRSQPVG
jgi:hypothetical protein